MLLFEVYDQGKPARRFATDAASLLGAEGVPIRGEVTFADGTIRCTRRTAGSVALALPWRAGAAGQLLLATTRLPEAETPYNLNLELARARLAAMIRKFEDWGLIDYPSAESLTEQFAALRKRFVEAVQLDATDRPAAASLADAVLADAIALSEQTAVFHADIFLNRRRRNTRGRPTFGCEINPTQTSAAYQKRLLEAADFLNLPTPWKLVEPQEGQTNLDPLDAWVQWAAKHKLPLSAGPLIDFEPDFLPERTFLWENDFESLREVIYEHIKMLVERYAKRVTTWKVISGAHAYNSFNLSFEQVLELTRMSCSLVRQLAPRSSIVIDLPLPWGEYAASNPRTIPPLVYADMCIQSGIRFDAFGVQVFMGAATEGLYVRDLMQISAKLDDFAPYAKPLHITGFGAPSATGADPADHWEGAAPPANAGTWRTAWSPAVQADWLEMFCRLALSKPFVATVCWRDLADVDGHYLPHGGLCAADLSPKPAHDRLRKFRAVMSRPRGGASDTAQ